MEFFFIACVVVAWYWGRGVFRVEVERSKDDSWISFGVCVSTNSDRFPAPFEYADADEEKSGNE